MLKISWRIYAVLILSALGGLAKIIGGIFYGSKAIFVDALTSLANLVAAYATIYYYKVSQKPPDIDHHYGHYKLGFGGALVSLAAYSFVAGLVIVELYRVEPYIVSINATFFAIAGFIFYCLAIMLAKREGEFFTPYSVFTVSELIESIVVILASLVGALYNYIVDYIGALILAAYIFVEIFSTGRDLLRNLSDIAPSTKFILNVKETIEENGFTVVDIKIRKIHSNLWHGDLLLKPSRKDELDKLSERVKKLKEELMKKHRLDATVELIE